MFTFSSIVLCESVSKSRWSVDNILNNNTSLWAYGLVGREKGEGRAAGKEGRMIDFRMSLSRRKGF